MIRNYFSCLVILGIMLAFSGMQMPQIMDYGVLLFLPALYAFMLVTLPPFLKMATKAGDEAFDPTLASKVLSAAGLLMGSVHIGYVLGVKHPGTNPQAMWLSIGVSLFLISLGISVEKIKPNRVVGIRTPWSLANLDNWQATHRFAAKIMVLTGVLLLVMSVLARTSIIFAIASLLFAVTTPVFYSLWYHQNVEKRP